MEHMRRRTLPLLILAASPLIVLNACASSAGGKNSGGQLTPPGYKVATRGKGECAATRAKAVAFDTVGMQIPLPSRLTWPTEPMPKDLVGKTADVHVQVSENGQVAREGIRVEGIGEHRFVAAL